MFVVLRFVIGLLVGGMAVAGFFVVSNLGDNGSNPVAAPSSTTLAGVSTTAATTTTTEVPWADEGEARFESTVVLPKAMSVDGGVATLEYDLVTLGPMRPSWFFEYGMLPGWIGEYGPAAAQPEEWLLVIGGESVEGTPSVTGTVVRFDVSDTASLNDVDDVRLVRWRVAMPFHHVFEMPLVSGETMVLPDGASVTVRHVLEQKSGSIFQFDTQRPDDDFAGTPVEFYISPVSGEWQYSGGEGGFGLISEDPVAPASVQLRYTRPMWLPVDGDIVVWEGSIRE
jgi:hypothetical protein